MFVPKVPIKNIPALVQIMAWRRSGAKPLSEPMIVSLMTHICITRPQLVLIVSLARHATMGTSFEVSATHRYKYLVPVDLI